VTARATPVLLNTKARAFRDAGEDAVLARVEAACRAAGLTADVRAVPPDRMGEALRAAREGGATTIVVGGGDGTVRSAAQELAGTDVALGILPLGHRNHAARDLGLPLDLEEAVRLLARAPLRAVDVGDLDGRAFLNNSCLGVYPFLVRVRDHHERRFKWSRLPALLRAAWVTFWRFPQLEVDFHRPEGVDVIRTPLVFVGNNEYMLGLDLGRRHSLDDGHLWLCAVRPMGRFRFLRLCLRSMLFPVPREDHVIARRAERVSIAVGAHRTWVSLDGEVERFRGVLRYRIRPGALRVIADPPASAAEAA
jgi:diacylglycerol kinase family enzyme